MFCGYLIKYRDSFRDVAAVFFCIFGSCGSVMVYFIFVAHSEDIIKLLTILDDNIFTYEEETDITPKYKWILEEGNMVICSLCLLGWLAIDLVLMFAIPILSILLGAEEVVVIPVWIPIDSVVLSYLIQMSLASAFATSLWYRWIFLLVISLEFDRQCERLCSALATIEERSRAEFAARYPGNVVAGIRTSPTCPLDTIWESTILENPLAPIEQGECFVMESRTEVNVVAEGKSYSSTEILIFKNNLIHCIHHLQELKR